MKKYAKACMKKGTGYRPTKKASAKVVKTVDDLLTTFSVDDLHSLMEEVKSGLTDRRDSRFDGIPKSIMNGLVKESTKLGEGLKLSVNLEMPLKVDVEFYTDMTDTEYLEMDIMDVSEDSWEWVTKERLMKQKTVKDKVAKHKKDLKVFSKKLEGVAKEHGLDVNDLAEALRILGGGYC